ncbi:MAG: hypothetical protein ACRCTI_05680, partial [Beijerinckiaceae bacterium]
MTGRITLAGDRLSAEIAPSIGGSLVSLACAGIRVSRDPAAGEGALSLSGFPMAPWFSRIAGGAFAFEGETVPAAPAGRGDVPADLHGLLWDRPFRVGQSDAGSCTLIADVEATPEQPYAFEARLTYALASDRFSMALNVRNRGRRLPFGLGLHPFFRRTPGFRLAFAADGFLATDANAMPVRAASMTEIPALAGEAGVDALVGL